MDITWYGLNCFRLTERGQISVVTDPFADGLGLEVPRLKGDVVTVSHNAPAFNNVEAVKGCEYVVDAPGEYEIGDVFIYGTAMHTVDEHTGQPVYNVGHSIHYGKLNVTHLGTLNHVPEQSTIEALGNVNVVIVPVGGGQGLKASEAAEVVAMIEPSYIVPMFYAIPNLHIELDSVERFLKVMGVSKVQQEDFLRVSASTLPEQPKVIILNPQA
ncbi:MAG: lactamase [Anaerolineaceae bacterium]|nr:MAG: lactamase [Anaerolineaceae bacterium]